MITRLPFIIFYLCIFFLGSSQIARACGCYPNSTVLDDFDNSKVVVIARLVSLEKANPPKPQPGGDINSALMRVERVFKGAMKVNDKVTFGQGDEVLGCTWSFGEEMIGHQYLLYLDPPEQPANPWYISTCDRSRDLEHANEDLSYLNKMEKVRGRTRISGVVHEEGSGVTLDGRKIRIIGINKTYIATTDKDGFYELYDVPPGRYVLEPELQFGWKVDEFRLTRPLKRSEINRAPGARVAFTLRAHKHFGIDIRLRMSNHVSGTVYDSNSKPMQWVCVSLALADDESSPDCNSLTDEHGRFQIDSVDAGTYVLILNCENKRTASMPFPKLYYPGVTERQKAETITLKHGESVKNLNFVIGK